jgi:DUF1009 family protein
MLEDLIPPDRTRKCKMGRIMESLDDKDQGILQKALDNPEVWAAKTLARELTMRGLSITEGPLGLHRNKSCGCFR